VKSKAFATMLSDASIPVRRRLFMTATERVLRGESDDVFSMDDETVYGQRFHQLTFKDAIAQGIISDYKILTITVSDQTIRDLVAENRLIDVKGDDTDAQSLAAAVALRRSFERHRITHAISFHRSIKAASTFADRQVVLDDAMESPLTSLHVSSKKSAGERAELMREFVGEQRALMTNARCLTEGVDVPAIDCVLFADPKQSVVDIVQAAGRALRPYPGKQYGYILLPLVVPAGMEIGTFAETTEFKQVARTITALSTQDERIAEQFRVVEHGRKPTGKIVEIEGDVAVGQQMDVAEFADQIGTRIWERVGRANWRPFGEAREYARSLGIASAKAWHAKKLSREIASDIPHNPDRVYQDQWITWGDWLETGNVRPGGTVYRPFVEARTHTSSCVVRVLQG
jgi:predicted helicase